jgi:DNA repair protein RadC
MDFYIYFQARIWGVSMIRNIQAVQGHAPEPCQQSVGCPGDSSGGISGTVADPKLIFAAALKAGASGLILSHNHPSSNLQAKPGRYFAD